MLYHIPKVLSAAQLGECRQLMAAAPWIDGRISSGSSSGRVKNNAEISLQDPKAQRLVEIVVGAISSSQAFGSAALPLKFVPPSFSRYEPGQSYGAHVDSAVMHVQVQGGTAMVRTDLAATLFISPPEDYDGGELMIEDTFGTSSIKLPAGDLVLYPASSLHRVEPIRRGKRLVSFFWVQSMVRDDFQRSVLRDLDITATQVNAALPTSPASVKLLSIYHNLLRVWSETP